MQIKGKQNSNLSYFGQFITLITSIVLLFCLSYHLTNFNAWNVPLGYGGDLWLVLTIIKAYMIGDIPLFGFKFVSLLNAPAIANWNDYPITEDLIFYGTGQIAKLIGLYAATNFLLLMSHLLAGISFWLVCKYYGVNAFLAFSGALAFAFSHFIFIRGLGHIVVGFCWHIPLLLMILEWVYNKKVTQLLSSKFYLAGLISLTAGMLNPYYSIMYCQFLLFAIIYFCVNKKFIYIRFPITLISLTALGFLLANSDTLLYAYINGSNQAFSGRNLASLELYALKIPDMLFAPGGGTWFTEFSKWVYYDRAYVKGEYWSPYLGFFGLFSLFVFISINSFEALRGKFVNVSVHYWHAIWVLLFSIVGGVNLLFGTAGFTFLRATNRLSIFILAIITIFTLRYLTKHISNRTAIIIAIIISYAVWFEQLAPRIKANPPVPNAIEKMIISDKKFVKEIEASNPNGKIFMLPVMQFPEVGPINKMGDYEPLRLYINSNNLHYSYGSNKGRGDSEWQLDIESLSPEEMVKKLQIYGFDAIVINRKGYEDKGDLLISGLEEYSNIFAESEDFMAFQLKPSYEDSEPIISFTKNNVSSSWSTDEITHRWARKSMADIAITSFNKNVIKKTISFEIFSLVESEVKIYNNNQLLKTLNIPVGERVEFGPVDIDVLPGKNYIRIKSNRWPRRAGNGDLRRLTFGISNFNLLNIN
tara:strand:+ start:18530 stop:20632 length:2103 start_codon:yes stop_codon:yes gene_type:complete